MRDRLTHPRGYTQSEQAIKRRIDGASRAVN
jgi:hypothetical protein